MAVRKRKGHLGSSVKATMDVRVRAQAVKTRDRCVTCLEFPWYRSRRALDNTEDPPVASRAVLGDPEMQVTAQGPLSIATQHIQNMSRSARVLANLDPSSRQLLTRLSASCPRLRTQCLQSSCLHAACTATSHPSLPLPAHHILHPFKPTASVSSQSYSTARFIAPPRREVGLNTPPKQQCGLFKISRTLIAVQTLGCERSSEHAQHR